MLNTQFADYAPWVGDINMRELGSLTAFETGQVTEYALRSIEARGRLFVVPGQDVYEGQVRAIFVCIALVYVRSKLDSCLAMCPLVTVFKLCVVPPLRICAVR